MKNISPTVKSAVVLLATLACLWSVVPAQVATLKDWTNVYHGNLKTQQDIIYTVPAGSNSNRLLVVAVASTVSSNASISVTITYGGKTFTLANGDMDLTSMKQHSALYYLDETSVEQASGETLSVTVAPTIPTKKLINTDVWAAVFDQVNQTSPLTDSKNYNSINTKFTSFSFATPLSIDAYNQSVEIVSALNTSSKVIPVITYAPEWNMMSDTTFPLTDGLSSFYIRNGVADRNIPSSGTTDPSPTLLNPSSYTSMTALSLNYEIPPPPTVQASNVTFSDVTASSFTINWTPGNGTNRIVLVKSGSAVDADPVNGTNYSASNLFGSGSEIGTGNYVVYNGTGNSVTVHNLDASTIYHVAVFEFSGPPGLENYLLPDPARGSQMTGAATINTGDYRTISSGDWGTPENWQTYLGGAWVPAGTPPSSASGTITIRYGHTITVAADVSVDQVVLSDGAQVTISPGITLTLEDGAGAVDMIVNGLLYNSGIVGGTGVLAFNSGSTYQHGMDGGSIPTSTWDANSTCLVSGITEAAPTGLGQNFGNLTWNCVSQTGNAALNSDITLQGRFRLTSTGSGRISLTDNGTSRSLTISRSYIQTGGILDFNSNATGSAVTYLYVGGNFAFTGGTMTETSQSGRGSVNFNGNGASQLFTSGGLFSNTIDFTVDDGAFLQMVAGATPSRISGSNGTFTLSPGATLGITDPNGITKTLTGSSGGNIQVSGSRNYDTEANYIYNGSVNQVTGTLSSIGLPATVNSLAINNTGGVVTFTSACAATSDMTFSTGSMTDLGNFTHTTNMLILGDLGQQAGSYGGETSGADFVKGEFFVPGPGIVINGAPDGSWLGLTTDWNSGSNWIGGIPTSETHARISSHVANQPVISGEITAMSDIVTIYANASLTIEPTGSATFGTIENFGTLNLNSGPGGIASLIFDSYTGTGPTHIQLYLTGGGNETNYPWHYISSPVDQLSVTDVMSSGNDPAANDLAAYYETSVTDNKDMAWFGYDGWNYQTDDGLPAGSTFSTLEVGKGYNYYSYYDATRVFGGDLNNGDFPISLDCSVPDNDINGWNLLGNPFSSSIDWDYIASTLPAGGEIDNAIYFTRNNSVVSYVVGVPSTSGVSGDIPPMQGFFVKANSADQSITLPAAARVHSSQTRYKGAGQIIPLIRLRVESENKSDETVIRFNEKASDTFDSHLDAYKLGMKKSSLSLWTVSGTIPYSINSIPFPEEKREIPVGVKISEQGNYRLSVSELTGLDNYTISLSDKLTGITFDLRKTPSFSFSAGTGIFTNRFALRISDSFGSTGNLKETDSNFNIFSSFGMLNIQTLSDEWDGRSGIVEVIDMAGRTVDRLDHTEFRKNSLIQVPESELNGLYFVKIQSGVLRYVGKVVIK